MSSQCPYPYKTPALWSVRRLGNHQIQHNLAPSGTWQLTPAERRVSVPAGERDTSQAGSSIAATIQGQNCTPCPSLNNSRIADITQRVTSTPSATQRWSTNTLTARLGTSSRRRPAPGGTSQTDSTRRVECCPASGIPWFPTPLSSLAKLPSLIPDPEAHTIITNPLRTRATERNPRQRQWQLQLQAVSAPQSVVSGSCSIYWFGHSDIMRDVFTTGRLLDLYMWNRWPCMSTSDLEMVSYARRRVV